MHQVTARAFAWWKECKTIANNCTKHASRARKDIPKKLEQYPRPPTRGPKSSVGNFDMDNVSLAPQFTKYTVNCVSRDLSSVLTSRLCVYSLYVAHSTQQPSASFMSALSHIQQTAFAFRALTVSEMTEALAITRVDSDAVVEIEDLPDVIDEEYVNSEIVDICAALVETREAKDQSDLGARTVHLIHSSVRDFLRSAVPQSSANSKNNHMEVQSGLNSTQAHGYLTEMCLRYLDCAETWQRIVNEVAGLCHGAFVKYATEYWHQHLEIVGKEQSGLIHTVKKFLHTNNENFHCWARYCEPTKTGIDKSKEHDSQIATPMYYVASFNLPSNVYNDLVCLGCPSGRVVLFRLQ